VPRRTSGRSDREDTEGEPPALIKEAIWLLQPQNWRRHWKAIVVSFAVLGGAFVVPKFTNYVPGQSVPEPRENDRGLLSEEEGLWGIGHALERADLQGAIRLLAGFNQGQAKVDECQHVYDYAMKNRKLEEALSAVNLCWDGESKREKLADIEHERLKR
jgi:hypothetical protein